MGWFALPSAANHYQPTDTPDLSAANLRAAKQPEAQAAEVAERIGTVVGTGLVLLGAPLNLEELLERVLRLPHRRRRRGRGGLGRRRSG